MEGTAGIYLERLMRMNTSVKTVRVLANIEIEVFPNARLANEPT
jgi:hypothetical protein